MHGVIEVRIASCFPADVVIREPLLNGPVGEGMSHLAPPDAKETTYRIPSSAARAEEMRALIGSSVT
jgi:hypothetical protein